MGQSKSGRVTRPFQRLPKILTGTSTTGPRSTDPESNAHLIGNSLYTRSKPEKKMSPREKKVREKFFIPKNLFYICIYKITIT